MKIAPAQVYKSDRPDTLADLRAAMSRNDDFDPDPERLAALLGVSVFEVLVTLEALELDGELLP